MECYCCTCRATEYGDSQVYDNPDPACRNHGAHGLRECVKHNCPPEPCKWGDGCGMTIDKVSERHH